MDALETAETAENLVFVLGLSLATLRLLLLTLLLPNPKAKLILDPLRSLGALLDIADGAVLDWAPDGGVVQLAVLGLRDAKAVLENRGGNKRVGRHRQ